ncbi:RHS repeat-associated core domain-containing protein [Pseudomonas sp. SDI]|uniref:RHS repeat-associated core domain-containing protein n=1 Tax=Pseudomonas sp. SDI TaxID=2170734 RepID=UPI0035318674
MARTDTDTDTDPLQPERRAQRYYFHTDQLGTPLDMTDESGQFVWRGFYKAWGRVEAKTPTQLEQNLRLQGQYYDAETYLHYNTFRYYDPGVGRFTTQDPIGLAGGVNLYRYGRNPTGTIDPWGWCSTKLGNNMGARRFDGMANHHLIPEEIMKSPAYKNMFKRLRNIGWDGDGASNGKFLPGSRNLSKAMGAPGHWSNHPQYTEAVKNKLSWINSNQGRLSDTQLILGIRALQGWANAGLENGKFITDKITGKLM